MKTIAKFFSYNFSRPLSITIEFENGIIQETEEDRTGEKVEDEEEKKEEVVSQFP